MNDDPLPETRKGFAHSVRRVTAGVLIAIPLVAVTTLTLIFSRMPTVSIVIGIAGIAMLQAAETFDSKRLAGIGGVLAFSGVLAWGILTT